MVYLLFVSYYKYTGKEKEKEVITMEYVSLYEETDNPYEKTFIDAKDDGESLQILAKDVTAEGSYGMLYVVDKSESEKLLDLLGIERNKLIKWLGF